MTAINEALIIAFYTHKLHVGDMCKDIECPSDSMMQMCAELFAVLLEVNCFEIINTIRKCNCNFDIAKSDIPQFSSLSDCVFKVPVIVRDCGIEDLTFTQMGYMLRTKPRKEGADFKYGENQSKTAAQMGLCSIVGSKIYPSYLGLAFNKLPKDVQNKVYPKLILYIPYIFNQYARKASYEDINKSVSILAKSTQTRRLSNIWSLIKEVNNILPYEFQIIRY